MNSPDEPLVVVLAGPNGAGKSTSARRLLEGGYAVSEFVNADTIALAADVVVSTPNLLAGDRDHSWSDLYSAEREGRSLYRPEAAVFTDAPGS